jgi:hypothetical protein
VRERDRDVDAAFVGELRDVRPGRARAVRRRTDRCPVRVRAERPPREAERDRDRLERFAVEPAERLDREAPARLRPEPDFLPPPVCLFTVAQAMRSAVSVLRPRLLADSSMCSACRFCLPV